MFKEISTVPDLPEIEKKIISYWEKIDVVEKLKELRKDSPKKVYYDGPITANNMPHYGHAITWTMKDVVPRFWSMQGNYVSRNMGWDCQGIPVEYEIEKQLGFENKEDIEEYGVEKFNKLCRESVFKYRDSIFYYETRVGRWFDEKDMYYTMDNDYIESMWWSLKELYKKGLLYEGHKVVAYSTRAGTPLSTHEVREGGYKEVEDTFVTVKFTLKDDSDTHILAWTTTPWTIPGNLLLAIGKKIEYSKVNFEQNNYIVASDLVEKIFEGKEYKVLEKLNAEDLDGIEYIPPFDYFEDKRSEGVFKVVIADHANTDEGTGIVHLAPYGAEDFDVFMSLGISLFDYLDDTAHFTDLLPKYKGMFYKKANKYIVEDLEAQGKLFATGTYMHRMPMCWRTSTPLIYKPIKSWYVAVTKIKDKMLEQNEQINWVPEHIKNGMSYQWLSNARDWALSRNRYWGTPLPLWINDKTGEYKMIGSFEELKELSGVTIEDPHRPYVDDITWEDSVNGGTFKRVTDVIDVWYDSGAVPFAKLHYPFENQDKLYETLPAEYISEGTDQVRLWFYTMHVLGVALFDKVPYKNVVVTGMLNDKNDKKLSKSKKNYPPMDQALDEFGGDVLRLFLLSSPIVQAESARFYEEALADVRKEFFIPLWNSLKYFTIYANNHNFKPSLELKNSDHNLDKWIIARLKEVNKSVIEKMESYLIMEAARELIPFVSDLSTWYIRRSRDRISSGDENALSTLYFVLLSFSKVCAPFVPFISEEMYDILNVRSLKNLESIHLDTFDDLGELTSEDQQVLAKTKNTRDLVSKSLSLRMSESIAVRQPLSLLITTIKETDYFMYQVLEEVNVKEIKTVNGINESPNFAIDEEKTVAINTELTPDLVIEGDYRNMVRKFQSLRKKQGLSISDEIKAYYPDTEQNKKVIDTYEVELKEKIQAKSISVGDSYLIEKI